MSIPLSPSAKILVTRADRIGDLVLSTPVFSELRTRFPQARIACLTLLENREIVEGNPCLNEIILYDKRGSEKGIFGNLKFAAYLASKKFDLVIHLHATNRMHWVTWLAGIPVRIGWRRRCGWALTHAYDDVKKQGERHEAEYNFDLLKPLGISCPGRLETYFPVSPRSVRSLEELLRHHGITREKPWVVFNPTASCPSKRWPPERFGCLADEVARRYDAFFIAVGAPGDRPIIEKMKRAASVPIEDLSGRLSLGMLGALLKDASLLVSNDSGPVHIGSAVGTPVVSIFGRKQGGLSPTRWRPLGARARVLWKDVGCETCLAHRCQIHYLCLDAVSVQDVFSCVTQLDEKLTGERVSL